MEEPLRIEPALHGDRDYLGVGAMLRALGTLNKTGDLKEAKQYLEESLRMNRELHGDRDHRDVGGHVGMHWACSVCKQEI